MIHKKNKLVGILFSILIASQLLSGNVMVEAFEGSANGNITRMSPAIVAPRIATVDVYSYQDVVDAIAANPSVALVLKQDIDFTDMVTIPVNHQVTLLTDGNPYTITMASASSRQALFFVLVNAELAIDGAVTLDANQRTTRANIYCNGILIMNSSDAVIKNFRTSSANSAAIIIEGGNAKFYLNHGVIENNEVSNQYSAAGVLVKNSGYFEMNGGIIRNNNTTTINSGGGVRIDGYLSNSSPNNKHTTIFVMNDGEISNNTSHDGAGVYLVGGDPFNNDYYSRAIFEMNGGKISNNQANSGSTRNSGGGGIFVYLGSEFTMNDGEISGNTVHGVGGGVATYDLYYTYYGKTEYQNPWYTWFPASFTMNGGKIIDNEALATGAGGDGGCGGGVYSASNFVTLKAGLISGNVASRQGGGAYVGSVPYSIVLSDVTIKGNEANILGGGIWLCPTGTAKFYSQRSAAIYDNSVTGNPGAGDDIAVVRHTGKQFDIKITDRMLGGGSANWHIDGAINDSTELGMAVIGAPRYTSASPNPITDIEGQNLVSFAIKSVPSETAKQLAESKAELVIENNRAERGGGIGSNGTLILGDANSEDKAVVIQKHWTNRPNNLKLPSSITVYLEIDGYHLDEIQLSESGNWRDSSIVGLPMDAAVNVVEVAVDGFKTSYNISHSSDNKTIYVTITNDYIGGKDVPKTSVKDTEIFIYCGIIIGISIYILVKKKMPTAC